MSPVVVPIEVVEISNNADAIMRLLIGHIHNKS